MPEKRPMMSGSAQREEIFCMNVLIHDFDDAFFAAAAELDVAAAFT